MDNWEQASTSLQGVIDQEIPVNVVLLLVLAGSPFKDGE